MKKLAVLLVLLLTPAFAQSLQVSLGSPFGINAGVRLPLVPFLLDGRAYAGLNFFSSGGTSFGGGVDALLSIPLTDVYAGAGLFFGSGNALSLIGTGTVGARGVIGTYLNVGLPLVGIFVEAYPMFYFRPTTAFGLGGAVGVNVGF